MPACSYGDEGAGNAIDPRYRNSTFMDDGERISVGMRWSYASDRGVVETTRGEDDSAVAGTTPGCLM